MLTIADQCILRSCFNNILSHLSPLTSEVVGALQMTLQQYLSTLPCLPLPSENLLTPFPPIPWWYLPISSVFLSFLLLSLSPAELSSPCPRIHLSFLFFTMIRRSSCTPNCILDSAANLPVCHMFFVGNIQKSPIASHLKGLDPSLDFCCQDPGIKEDR